MRHANRVLAGLALAVLLPLGLYVAAYFALVYAGPTVSTHSPYYRDRYRYLPPDLATVVFTPLFYLDRDYLRPGYWEQSIDDFEP